MNDPTNESCVIPFPDMPTTYELTREVPDHEVLLVFNGDNDAAEFRDWLEDKGYSEFQKHLFRKNGFV